MQIELSSKEFRRLLDLVYIGNWVLNSTRGDDRFRIMMPWKVKYFPSAPLFLSPGMGRLSPPGPIPKVGSTRPSPIMKTMYSMKFLPRSCPAGIWTTRKLPKKTTMKSQDGWTNICRNLKPVVWIIWFWKKNSSQSVKRAGKIRHVFHFSNSASPARKMSPAPMVITTSPSRTILRSWSVTSGNVSQ